MTSQEIIGRAILDGTPEARQLAEDRLTLQTLVARRVTCVKTGAILDQRSAVAAEVTLTSGEQSWIGPFAPSATLPLTVMRGNMATWAAETPTIASIRLLVGAELFGGAPVASPAPSKKRSTITAVTHEQLSLDL